MRCVQVEWTDKEHSKQRVATTSGSMSWWVFRCRKQWRLSGRPVRRAPGSSCRDCRGDESARSTGVHSIASLHIAARKPDTDPKTDPNANSETCADRLGWQIDQRSLFVGCGNEESVLLPGSGDMLQIPVFRGPQVKKPVSRLCL